MTMPTDAWGHPLTATAEAADAYRRGVDRMLAYELGVDDALRQAVALDPTFALARSQLGLFHFFRGDRDQARAMASAATALAESATERERRHAAILAAPILGNAPDAPKWVAEHLDHAPTDAPIVLQWLGANFYGGGVTKREAMLAQFDRLAPAFGDDWWFLSWHAFANHEMDRLSDARRLVERSLQLRRGGGQAAHAMSHVFFEEHDVDGGADWLGDWLDEFPHQGGFHRHLTWHRALFLLAQGRHSDAMALHDGSIRPGADAEGDALGEIADAASLLWRCGLHQTVNGNGATAATLPWSPIAELAQTAYPQPGMAWVDVHRAMALAALSDRVGLGSLLDGLRNAAEHGHPTAAEIVAPVVEALFEFAAGDYGAAADRLSAVREKLVALGGSNAQRDVFEETLVEAYLRAGRSDEALTLLNERLERGATARDLFRLGRAKSAREELDDAAAAFRRAAAIWSEADSDHPEVQALQSLREAAV